MTSPSPTPSPTQAPQPQPPPLTNSHSQSHTHSSYSSYRHLPTTLPSQTHPHLLLRTLEPADAPALAALLSDPRNTALDGPPSKPMDVATAVAVIRRMRDSAARPTVDGEGEGEGRVIGLGGFGSIKDVPVPVDEAGGGVVGVEESEGDKRGFLRVGDVGAMIEPAYRGRGLGAEAVRLAMEWGFRAARDGGLQLDRVTATTLAANGPMVAVLERKMGWRGRRKEGEGQGAEEVEFAMTVAEWEERMGRAGLPT
ncbi:hypothetical protein F4779DRAFT_614111 [Xylariaceae sp. FL0662B]|nr:hypothetical protein F4779DRAFT_614111 [Xylariaceae sp. FL0662B]